MLLFTAQYLEYTVRMYVEVSILSLLSYFLFLIFTAFYLSSFSTDHHQPTVPPKFNTVNKNKNPQLLYIDSKPRRVN